MESVSSHPDLPGSKAISNVCLRRLSLADGQEVSQRCKHPANMRVSQISVFKILTCIQSFCRNYGSLKMECHVNPEMNVLSFVRAQVTIWLAGITSSRSSGRNICSQRNQNGLQRRQKFSSQWNTRDLEIQQLLRGSAVKKFSRWWEAVHLKILWLRNSWEEIQLAGRVLFDS